MVVLVGLAGQVPIDQVSRKSTRYDVMRQFADYLRLPPDIFPMTSLGCGPHLCLPYLKKGLDANLKGPFVYRIVDQLLSLDDLRHSSPETLDYVFHQSVTDLMATSDPLSSEVLPLILAVKCATLNLRQVTSTQLDILLGPSKDERRELVVAVNREIKKVFSSEGGGISAAKQRVIEEVRECGAEPSLSFQCERNGTITITKEGLVQSDSVIPYSSLVNVTFSFKQHSILLDTHSNSTQQSKMELVLGNRNQQESFLTLMDIAYKRAIPGDLVIDHKVSDDVVLETLLYHDPRFICPDGIHNYTLAGLPPVVRRVEDSKEAERILRFPGNERKFLVVVTENNVSKEFSKLLKQFHLFLSVGEKVLEKKILVMSGKYHIDKHQSYLSLAKLFSRIEITEKTGAVRKLEDNFITEADIEQFHLAEMVAKTKGECNLTSVCVTLDPSSVSHHYLYTVHRGAIVLPHRRVRVTRIVAHNKDYRRIIQVPLIEHVKELMLRDLSCDHIVGILGAMRDGDLTCLVEEECGIPLDRHIGTMTPSQLEPVHLFQFGLQICRGIKYLHSLNITHGLPALHNAILTPSGLVKLGFVGILPKLMKKRDIHNGLVLKEYGEVTEMAHTARWLHRAMVVSSIPWCREVDR
eukprot:sb/3462951/